MSVALKSINPVGGVVNVYGTDYVINLRHDIGIIFADEEHVEFLLGMKNGCCGSKHPKFVRATDQDLIEWRKEL